MERYEEYKDSGVEWIGEIPEGWEVKKLKYVADANPSNIDKKSKDNEKAILLCNYVDVYKNEFISSELIFMKATASVDQIKKFVLEKGDVIATKDSETPNDIAVPSLVIEDFDDVVCGYHLTHIKPKKINGVYLFRYFQSNYLTSYFNVSANGVTRYGLGVDKFNSALILNPPISEQNAIANYLDRKTAEIDQLIAQKEHLLNLYEEEKTAIINQAVTQGINSKVKLKNSGVGWLGEIPEHWGVKRSRYLFEIRKRIAGELGYDILSITQNGIKVKDIRSNDGQIASDYSKYQIVKKGDFAMNHMDLLTGYIDIANQEGVTSPDYRVFSSIDNKSVSNYYLLLFQMMYTRKIFYAFGRGAALFGRWRLPADEFKSFLFPYPSKSEQSIIVQYIETETTRINIKITKTKKIIALQKEYRTALISEVVTGKIKVTSLTNGEIA